MKKLLLLSALLFSTCFASGDRVQNEINRLRQVFPPLSEMTTEVKEPLNVIFFEKRIKGGASFSQAIYHVYLKTAYIPNDINLFKLPHVLIHEYFHFFPMEKLNKSQRDAWCRSWERDGHTSVSTLGMASCEEDFAETFAFYNYGVRGKHTFTAPLSALEGSTRLRLLSIYSNKLK